MPAGLTTDPCGISLKARLMQWLGPELKPRLVHRLDRCTQGIMVVALSSAAARFHSDQLKARGWRKIYVVRVAALDLELAETKLLGTHRC